MPQGNKYCTKRWIRAAIRPSNDIATSPFLALPPELRNKIYIYLQILTQSEASNKRFCWPQILATCRRINKEATGILYGSNVMNIEIGSRWRYAGRVLGCEMDIQRWWAFVLSHDRQVHFRDYPRTLNYLLGEWPTFLRRAHHLRLDLRLKLICDGPSGRSVHDGLSHLSRLVYALCSFLCGGASFELESLHINVEIDVQQATISNCSLKQILWPLAKLARPDILVLNGLSTEVAEYLTKISKQYQSIPRNNLTDDQVIARPPSAQLSSTRDERQSPKPTATSVRRKLAQCRSIYKEYKQEFATIAMSK